MVHRKQTKNRCFGLHDFSKFLIHVSFQWCWFKQEKIGIVVFCSLWGLKIKYFSLLKKLLLGTAFVDLKPEAEPEVSETHFSFLM